MTLAPPTVADLEAERRVWLDPAERRAAAAASDAAVAAARVLRSLPPDEPRLTAERRRAMLAEMAPRRLR